MKYAVSWAGYLDAFCFNPTIYTTICAKLCYVCKMETVIQLSVQL